MKRFRLTPLFLLALAASLPAQTPDINPDSPPAAATLHQWLHSGDPRLIAWSADFARRNQDTNLLGEMPDFLLNAAIPAPYGGNEAQAAQRRALQTVLDALIQTQTHVPPDSISAVASSFPAQASILIARLPLSESRPTLESWTYGAAGTPSEARLARIATMLLAKDPVPSFVFHNSERISLVAAVVDDAEEDLRITIRKDNSGGSGHSSSMSCGDALGYSSPAGWPPVYTYALDESNRSGVNGPVLVDIGGDSIYSTRLPENVGGGSCSGSWVQPLNPQTRRRLLAYWLQIPETEIPWKPIEDFSIVWTGKSVYRQQLGEIIESQRKKLNATVEALRNRGLLKPDEPAMPRLVISVQCDMSPCPLQ